MPTHQAQLFRQLTDHVTLFVAGAELTAEQRHGLEARGIRIVEGEVAAVEVADDVLTGVRLVDGEVIPLDALVVATRMMARAEILERLGAEMTDTPFGRQVTTGPMGATTVPGVWVAGNVANPMAQVVIAAGEGTMTGAVVNADLVEEEIAAAREHLDSADPVHG